MAKKSIFSQIHKSIKHAVEKTTAASTVSANMKTEGQDGPKADGYSIDEKEFEVTEDTKQKILTEKDQRGERTVPKADIEEPDKARDMYMQAEAERVMEAARQKQMSNEQMSSMNKECARLERLNDAKEEAMIHDMTEQVLGRTYKVPGTNISYDDAAIMARNGIRDSDELTGISLEDDGFENSVEEVQEMMKGYVYNGVPDIEEFYTMTQDYGADVIAQAYVNVAKECSRQDVPQLTRIDERFDFEHPAFERQFDYIRNHDPEADRVLDILDMEMGRDRADD